MSKLIIGRRRFRPATWLAFVIFAALPAYGHEQTAPWLDPATLDEGVYVEVRHPRVIRDAGAFDVSVIVNNLSGDGDVVVEQVRYSLPVSFEVIVHDRHRRLASKRAAYRQYRSTRKLLDYFARAGDQQTVTSLLAQKRALLMEITAGTFRDRHSLAAGVVPTSIGSAVSLDVEIDLAQGGRPRTIQRSIDIPVQPTLPRGADGDWFAGDQHLHTAFSIDAFFLHGTSENVRSYASTARVVGLDWIIITDHTNLDFLWWYSPVLFAAGEAQARAARDQDGYLALQGQEMGAGSLGPLGESAHLLVYPGTADSTGFLPNPCPGLILNHVNCEPEQVVLDRINDNGGLGFIAHPFDIGPLTYAPWDRDNGASGWAGVEIFNSNRGVFGPSDQQSVDWWHDLLNEIAPPENGALPARPDFPTRFPVGLGNSDAHVPGLIGNTFSYCRLLSNAGAGATLTRAAVVDAYVNGRCVATNGPLVYGKIGDAGTGDVAIVADGQNRLSVTLRTTAEFGPVGDYAITILVNGSPRLVIPPSGSPDFETTVLVDDLLGAPDTFVTLRADSTNGGFVAIANPIWLQF